MSIISEKAENSSTEFNLFKTMGEITHENPQIEKYDTPF
jgi:hypothetical protein